MVVTRSSLGRADRAAVFRLSCQPPRGDFPSPARSCAALENDPKIVTDPKSGVCYGFFAAEDRVTISGWIDGRPVRSAFTTDCGWEPSMPLVRAGLYGAFVYQARQGQGLLGSDLDTEAGLSAIPDSTVTVRDVRLTA
jgi:hypothetical protein